MITIITGDKGVGKTTFILKTIQEIKSSGRTVYGIITPPIFNKLQEKIGFSALNTATGEEWELARTDKFLSGPTFGPFHFCGNGFAKANRELLQNLKLKKEIIFLDEIGPLELKNQEGYYPALKHMKKNTKDQNIILVIRFSLIEKFISTYIPGQKYKILSVTVENRDSLSLGL